MRGTWRGRRAADKQHVNGVWRSVFIVDVADGSLHLTFRAAGRVDNLRSCACHALLYFYASQRCTATRCYSVSPPTRGCCICKQGVQHAACCAAAGDAAHGLERGPLAGRPGRPAGPLGRHRRALHGQRRVDGRRASLSVLWRSTCGVTCVTEKKHFHESSPRRRGTTPFRPRIQGGHHESIVGVTASGYKGTC